jgi:hypothetical protein
MKTLATRPKSRSALPVPGPRGALLPQPAVLLRELVAHLRENRTQLRGLRWTSPS